MKTLQLVQGSPEWHAHRATHFNASDAPAMLGCSPYKTRTQLLDEMKCGIAGDVDAATQRRFDDGHRFEALARPLAEKIIGEELYPCVGEDGRLSASFDGLTLLEDCAWEHKTLNDAIRASAYEGTDANGEFCCEGSPAPLPEHYRAQMEQQCMVSGATQVLFMASVWKGDTLVEERHCWYLPDAELRARIISGWQQFERDLETHVPTAKAAPVAIGRAPDSLPALRIELTGLVTASNLEQFRDTAIEVFRNINTDLQTDEDFADAEKTVKWCGDIEDRLRAAKDHALSQTQSIDELFRAIDSISAEARSKRLELDKLVKARKESLRSEIAYAGRDAVNAHYATINATLGEHAIAVPATLGADLNAAIKGKRTITSIRDAVDTAVASAKIAASQKADQVRACIAALAEHAEHQSLFADRVQLCASKSPEDLRNLIAARIADHQAREAARIEVERQKIRAEEEARAKAEVERDRLTEEHKTAVEVRAGDVTGALRAAEEPGIGIAKPPTSSARVKLGEINARIAPLSITADGLAQLGFQSVGTERAAKLYAESDFPAMCAALTALIQRVAAQKVAA